MTAEATGGHEAVLDHDKETPSHELLTMPTADADASNGYLRKRRDSGTRIESNGFIVVDGQTRDGDDDGTTTEPEEKMDRPKITSLLKPVSETKKVSKAADAYLEFFNNNNKEGAEGMRQDNSSDLANQYYDLATDFFEYGWGESFHFATMHKGESFEHAIAKHEYRIALKLRIEPGEKVLDMGCGVGGPARHIATFTEAKITGLNINDYQIHRARELTKAAGVDHLCEFVKGDFCKAPLASETFDKAYAIEASCHAADLSKVYQEAYRMLKPGGLFASYEWVMTDTYDPTNPYHKQLKEEIMLGDGLPDINSIETVLHAVKSNGFELLETADMVKYSPVPWYSFMQPRWTLSDLKITPLGRWLTHVALMGMELVGYAPSGSVKVHRTLCKGADSLVNAGKEGVFSPMFLVVARKPGKPTQ